MELEYEEHIINIKYNLSLNYIKLNAYVRACDEALLGRDGYRRLASVEARLIREYQHFDLYNPDKEFNQQLIFDDEEHQGNPDEIIVDEQEISNGNTINLKLGGDGRNVGCKQNHVMMTVCLLMKKAIIERNETLAKVGNLFKYQLQDLQENGISISGALNSKYFCLFCNYEASVR
ncbi:hypothetical protein RhiirA1_480635 [Rhizophagus irregularis]|uniref:Uncharacterized protein n=1 Tax=Rhizophagus irregularis TaxID=588596 RepID=A0A2N0QP22_9GLOM|nr:hypothetical protein RhiirA1_480635 [Rhizophagus irregularis]